MSKTSFKTGSKNSIEVVVHIDETLSEPVLSDLKQSLCSDQGIEDVHVSPKTQHLMIVDYLPDSVNALGVLNCVKNKGVHAELVGSL